MEKSAHKLELQRRIADLEKKELWHLDVEDDPETYPLMPDQIDYLNEKISNKIKNKIANYFGQRFFENMIKNKQMIIKEVRGIENFLEVQGGAILTCNHFNVNDNYAVWRVIKPYMGKKKLWKVIREGNYTNSPKPFGMILRNCNTLPLSSNTETMKKFMTAVKVLLNRGEKILIYPEQAMWWNYRKPRPHKKGAYRIAVNNNTPIIPFFITMEDSEIIGGDGFPVQEYTIHISKAIYPKSDLNKNENMEYLKLENEKVSKEIYESFYGVKLKYDE